MLHRRVLSAFVGAGGLGLTALAINRAFFTGSSLEEAKRQEALMDTMKKLRRKQRVEAFRKEQEKSLLPKEVLPEELEEQERQKLMVQGAELIRDIEKKIRMHRREGVVQYMKELMDVESDSWEENTSKVSMKECGRFLQSKELFKSVMSELEEEQQERAEEFMAVIKPLVSDYLYRRNFVSFVQEAIAFEGNNYPTKKLSPKADHDHNEIMSYLKSLLAHDSLFWEDLWNDSLSKTTAMYFKTNDTALVTLKSTLEENEQKKLEHFILKMSDTVDEEIQKMEDMKISNLEFLKTRENNGVPDFWRSVDAWTGSHYIDWEKDTSQLVQKSLELVNLGKSKPVARDEVSQLMSNLLESGPDSWNTRENISNSKMCYIYYKIFPGHFATLKQGMDEAQLQQIGVFTEKMETRWGARYQVQRLINSEKVRMNKLIKNMVDLGLEHPTKCI